MGVQFVVGLEPVSWFSFIMFGAGQNFKIFVFWLVYHAKTRHTLFST